MRNFEKVVPQAITTCGASFVRFEPLTDGAERAWFEVDSGRAAEILTPSNSTFRKGTWTRFRSTLVCKQH